VAVNGIAVATVGAGALFLWSAVKGKTVLGTIQSLVRGQSPAAGASANPVPIASDIADAAAAAAGSVTLTDGAAAPAPASNTPASNQALAKMLATSMGYASWTTGAEWAAWVDLWDQESGWSITAANPHSDARGIAQNIDGYGPDYLEGNAQSQITWGINYIAGRYGDPIGAWQHELADDWY
jgi:hypothetical protein